jgi:integrase/recombinase XerD
MGTTKVDQASTSILHQILAGTVANIANGFLVDARSRGLSPNTIRSYTNEINALLAWLDKQGVVNFDELTADLLRKYLLALQERRNPGGQFAGYRVIRSLTYWWERETDGEYRSPIHKVKPPKVNAQPLPGIQQDEIKAPLDACKGQNGQRDKSIILFMADTGIRASELCDLKISNVNLMTGSTIIEHGKGDKRRTVYFGQRTRRELRKYLASRTVAQSNNALFVTDEGTPLTFWGLRQIIRRRANAAGIAEPGLHDFRRYFALNMLRNGVDLITLARLMGHSGITILQRYLAQVDTDLQVAHAKFSPVDRM